MLPLKFEPFVARRYLFSGQHKALVSVITVISILGVAVGVFALIVVIAVMEGFDANLTDKIIGAYAHMDINPSSPDAPAINPGEMIPKITAMPEVKAAAPYISRMALVQVPGTGSLIRQTGLVIWGVDFDAEPKITKMMSKVNGNRLPGEDEIVIGKDAVNRQLFVPLKTKLMITAPVFAETAMGRVPSIRNKTLGGIFETGYPDSDGGMGYMSLESARDLFRIPEGAVDGIHLVLNNPERAHEFRDKLQHELGPQVSVVTWQDRFPVLFDALRLEKWGMFIILLLIVLVAAFNIIGTLIMVVMEKTREIGILKSMGAHESSILRIFLFQGMIIGGIGTFLGSSLGLLLCYLLKYHIKINLASEAYMSDRIPLLINPWMDLLIVLSSLAICLGASIYPARQAAQLDPVEALRYE